MFWAAFTSRSWVAPQEHDHSRTLSGMDCCSAPHAEHIFDDGNHWSTATTCRPYPSALYSSMDRISAHETSEIARASEWCETILRTFRSSMAITWFSYTSRVVSLCR